MENQPEYLTDYFIDVYRDPETATSQNMNAVFGEFLGEQIRLDRDFDSRSLLNAANSEEDYDWDGLKEDFRIFLEKRFDRYHDGNLDNPERSDLGLDIETHYSLGYVGTDIVDHSLSTSNEVFMTSVIQFQETSSEDEEYAVEVEYLDTDEGLEAIEYLLERGKAEKVEKMITRAVNRNDNERALKAYEVLAEKAPLVADRIIEEVDDPDLKASMDAKIFENSKESFRDFRDQLDF